MTDKTLENQFIDVFQKNIGIILKISRAFTKNAHDREDLINDIAYELWKAFPGFQGQSKVSTWIYRVALNTSMNYKRKYKSKPVFFSDIKENKNYTLLIEENNYEGIEKLYNCINDLNEINKVIIILYLDGKTHEEIAEITGISKTNTGTRISRIKEQLKEMINSKN